MDKDPDALSEVVNMAKEALPYLLTIIVAAWGGTVAYLEDLHKSGAKFSARNWLARIIVSGFVGVLTYWLCVAMGMEFGPMTAFCIAVSGHMGVEAMRVFVRIRNRVLGVTEEESKVDKQPQN